MRYRKVSTFVEAVQVNRIDDHPAVLSFSNPNTPSGLKDDRGIGWIRTLEGGHVVYSGAFVVGPGAKGEFWPVDEEVFLATYRVAPASTFVEIVEELAKRQHGAWFVAQVAKGVLSCPSAEGREQLLSWDRLHDSVKEVNRAQVRTTLANLLEVGLWEPPLPVEKIK